MVLLRPLLLVVLLAISGCSLPPFMKGSGDTAAASPTSRAPGSGPVLATPTEALPPPAGAEPAIDALPPAPLPRERPRTAPATLGPASKALVSQAQAQRKKGDLPGASVSLDRALRIEPNNPLLWIEMGRLRMDQRNFPQAENMGRKALAMSVGDDRTQSSAWQLISDSLRARGKNPEAEDAAAKARALVQQ
jgi:predicted Zn-dependent protease